MYLPRFTLRNLLLMTAGAGLLFFFFNRAMEGHAWAVGVAMAFLGLRARAGPVGQARALVT